MGVEAIEFLDVEEAHEKGADSANADARAVRHATACASQLAEYFAGRRTRFDLVLLPHGSTFQLAAWDALTGIPFGSTMTYAEQARAIGRPRAIRAVGQANGRNPLAIVVPCHRVIGADGRLTGYAGGVDRKRWLLDHEQRRG